MDQSLKGLAKSRNGFDTSRNGFNTSRNGFNTSPKAGDMRGKRANGEPRAPDKSWQGIDKSRTGALPRFPLDLQPYIRGFPRNMAAQLTLVGGHERSIFGLA